MSDSDRLEQATLRESYADPITRAQLLWSRGQICSEAGERVYPIQNGIPNFLRYEPRETDEIRLKLERLNDLARRLDWRRAIHEVFGEDTGETRYITDAERTAYLDLLPLHQETRALEIGCSLGQHTDEIAKRVGTLHALEIVPEQAEFARERCRQEGVSNVSIACGGDDCRLPYAGGRFDIAILNLVFEWCGSRAIEDSVPAAQRRLLSEAYRVLKTGGVLYLVTKNRYALRLLAGRGDEHAFSMRFGNAMPRWLLHLCLIARGRRRPEGLLYSHNALKRLILQQGFCDLSSYWAAPEMRNPRHFVPTDTASVREARRDEAFLQGTSRLSHFFMGRIPARFVKYFTPGLLFIAVK